MSFYPSTPGQHAPLSPALAQPAAGAPPPTQAGWRGEVDGMLRELHLHKSGVVFQPDEADHEGKHLDDAVAVHYGGADKQAAAVVVLDTKLVVLPARGRARTVRLPLGAHTVGCTAAVPTAGSRPGLLLALDLPTGTKAVVYYKDPLDTQAPVTVELPAPNSATCLCMAALLVSGGARVFLGMSDGSVLQISLGARPPVCTGFAQSTSASLIGAAAEAASSWLGGWGSTWLGAAASNPLASDGGDTAVGGASAAAGAASGQPIGALAVLETNSIFVLVGMSSHSLRLWDIDTERPFPSLDAPSGLTELRDIAVRGKGGSLVVLAQSDAGLSLCDVISRLRGDPLQQYEFAWSDEVHEFEWLAIELPPGGLPKLALVGIDSVFNDQAAPERAPIVHWPRAGKTGRLIARLHEGKIIPARPDRRLLIGADADRVVFIHGGGGTTVACTNDLSDDLCDALVRLRRGQRDAASSALWGSSGNLVPSVWDRLEPLIDITTPPELWASVVVKGVNSYCSELDAPRIAATSQVGVVTDLLTMTTEARELEDVHQMILQKLTAACESQGVFEGDDDMLPPMLLQQAEDLAQRSGQAVAAYELVKVGQRCEILRWASEHSTGKRITAEPLRLIALALKALSTNDDQLHAQRHAAPGTRAKAAQEAFELLRELSWRPVCAPSVVTPPELLHSDCGDVSTEKATHWALRDGAVLGRVADWLQVLAGLSEDLPESLDEQTVTWAVDCVEALIVGRGLADDGSAADREQKRYEALQALCGLGETGRSYAVQLAERVGDYRTRVQHWLQFDPQQLAADEAAAQARGWKDHREFLLKLCDAYYEHAAVPQHGDTDAGGFASVSVQPPGREGLSWLWHLLVTLKHLHEVEVNSNSSHGGSMDMVEDTESSTGAGEARISGENGDESYVTTFLQGKPNVQWLFALHNCENEAAPNPAPLRPIANLVAAAAERVPPGTHSNSLRRSLLAVQKLSHAAAGTLAGEEQALRQQTHALAMENVVAKCSQAGGALANHHFYGTIEPCDFDEIASGLWAYAETALEGRTDSDAMALAAIWGWILGLEKLPWLELTSGRGIDSSLTVFEREFAAGTFPLLLTHFNKLWLRLTNADAVGDSIDIDTVVANLLCARPPLALPWVLVVAHNLVHLNKKATLAACCMRRTVDFDQIAAFADLPAASAAQLPQLLRHGLICTRRDSS